VFQTDSENLFRSRKTAAGRLRCQVESLAEKCPGEHEAVERGGEEFLNSNIVRKRSLADPEKSGEAMKTSGKG
jgi:hypothetical protein